MIGNTRENQKKKTDLIDDLIVVVRDYVKGISIDDTEYFNDCINAIIDMCETKENIIDIMGWLIEMEGEATLINTMCKAQEYAYNLHPEEYEDA